jgi:phosphinothricin acetyltransferase
MLAPHAGDAATRGSRRPPALTAIWQPLRRQHDDHIDLHPFEPEGRRGWFDDHAPSGRHRLLVATGSDGTPVGYATTAAGGKAAYDTTVESSVYCRPDVVGRGIGTAVYSALFESIAGEDIHRIVAGISQPNPASVALHQRRGFREVGVFSNVGRKFGRYWDVAWFERPLRV